MSDETTEQIEADHPKLVLQAALSPADAASARDAALDIIATAAQSKSALHVDLDGDDPSPCAMQLLVSAARSAGAHGIAIEPSQQAEEILAAANLMQ